MKFWKILSLMVVVGLFTIQFAWALTCLPHQVKTGETMASLAEQYSANPNRLVIRKLNNHRTIYLTQENQLFPGETVYVIKEKINSSLKSTQTVTPRITQKSILSKSQPVVDQKSTLAEKKK